MPLFVRQPGQHPAPVENHPFRFGRHHPGRREKISLGGPKNNHGEARVT